MRLDTGNPTDRYTLSWTLATLQHRSSDLVELLGQHVRDVVPRVTVQTLLQTLLVHVVADEADATTQHEQRVDRTDIDVLLGLLTKD